MLLKRALIATGALAGGGILTTLDSAAGATSPSRARDIRILNFLLLLEYVQEAFYSEAASRAPLKGELMELAQVAGRQEKAHVETLTRNLGRHARQRPSFHFGDAVTNPDRFAAAAFELEETAVAAYIGQGANLTKPAIRVVAPIVSVEARHAAWIRDITHRLPAPHAADPSKTVAQTLKSLKERGIVAHA